MMVFATTSFLGAKIYERRGIKTAALLGVLSTALDIILCSLVALKNISTFENSFYGNMFWLIFTYEVRQASIPTSRRYIRDVIGNYKLALLISSITTIIEGATSLYLKKRLRLYLE